MSYHAVIDWQALLAERASTAEEELDRLMTFPSPSPHLSVPRVDVLATPPHTLMGCLKHRIVMHGMGHSMAEQVARRSAEAAVSARVVIMNNRVTASFRGSRAE